MSIGLSIPDCIDKCEYCAIHYKGGCIAGGGDDDFSPIHIAPSPEPKLTLDDYGRSFVFKMEDIINDNS